MINNKEGYNQSVTLEKQNEIENNQLPPASKKPILQKILPPVGGLLLLVGLVLWWNFPVFKVLAVGTPTPTPRPPTFTPAPTRTTTPSATPTIIATPTMDLYPDSIGLASDPESMDPPIYSSGLEVVVLDDDVLVTPVPEFSNPLWINSEQIATQMAIDIDNSYHATYGTFDTMSANWQMDVALQPGLYQIYVLDTVLSSGGILDFVVKLGERQLSPLLGENRVDYKTSYSDPAQQLDLWQPIGVYWLDTPELLSVSTSWGQRDDYTIVAVDRIALVHMPDSGMQILEKLPPGQLRYVIDETEAKVEATDYWTYLNESLAWGNQYQVLINPADGVKANYTPIDKLPYGKYQVLVWIPKVNGNGQLNYRVYFNGGDFSDEAANATIQLFMGNYTESQWVSLGTWEIPEIYKDTAQLSLGMQADGGQAGEIPLDAAAFVKIE